MTIIQSPPATGLAQREQPKQQRTAAAPERRPGLASPRNPGTLFSGWGPRLGN
jgi:hypothetical protein